MISVELATLIMSVSLVITVGAFLMLARSEGSYINVFIPTFIISVPAYYLLPLIYIRLFGTEGSAYAYLYVYATLAVENVCFIYAYLRTKGKVFRLPFSWSYQNFSGIAFACLLLGALMYLPVLLEFREFLLDPRQIYNLTRVGFGPQFFLSSTLSYIAVIFILFSNRSLFVKVSVVVVATCLLLLHGSKGEALNVVLILALHHVYVKQRKIGFKGALAVGSSMALIILLLFAATMSLGATPMDVVQSLTQYSDYTRNAMLVIDSKIPVQYGRLTIESNTIALIPRALMPDKRRDFGPFFLTQDLFPDWYDRETSPAFGAGVQYADFGSLAIVYLAVIALLKGWLARIFVNRLRAFRHPADFFVLAFVADIGLFPLGVGWFLPETFLVALFLRQLTTIGAKKIYAERRPTSSLPMPRPHFNALNDLPSAGS
jgi:hypothetical protein